MTTLLDALGWRRAFASVIALGLLVWGGVAAVLSLLLWIPVTLKISPLILHIAMWTVWFSWLGWWFPAMRQRRIQRDSQTAYARAFYPDILPGVWVGFAQLFKPVAYTHITDLRLTSLFGITVLLIGTLILAWGHHSLDLASTMFVNEYQPIPTLSREGIYQCISHPMFLGAVLISLGMGMLFGGTALWLGLINLLTLPIYSVLEDRRLRVIVGEDFTAYRESAGGFLPGH